MANIICCSFAKYVKREICSKLRNSVFGPTQELLNPLSYEERINVLISIESFVHLFIETDIYKI